MNGQSLQPLPAQPPHIAAGLSVQECCRKGGAPGDERNLAARLIGGSCAVRGNAARARRMNDHALHAVNTRAAVCDAS